MRAGVASWSIGSQLTYRSSGTLAAYTWLGAHTALTRRCRIENRKSREISAAGTHAAFEEARVAGFAVFQLPMNFLCLGNRLAAAVACSHFRGGPFFIYHAKIASIA